MTASFASLPADVLIHEIGARLDRTSLAQWRTSERAVAATLRAPRPSVERWEWAAHHTVRDTSSYSPPTCAFAPAHVPLVRCLDQAIHDDHMGRFEQLWPLFLATCRQVASEKGGWNAWRHVIYVCASAGSPCVWHRLAVALNAHFPRDSLNLTKPNPCHSNIDIPDLVCYAVSFGQWTFLRDVCGIPEETALDMALQDNPHRRDRYWSNVRHDCVTVLLRRHCFDDVAKICQHMYRIAGRLELDNIKIGRFCIAVCLGSLRHGWAPMVVSNARTYTYADLVEALFNATASAGIEALACARPDLLQQFHADPKRAKKASAVSTKSGMATDVLDWLLARGYLPNTFATFERVARSAANADAQWKRRRTLCWVRKRAADVPLGDGETPPAWLRDAALFGGD
jgi:hypothetical protein